MNKHSRFITPLATVLLLAFFFSLAGHTYGQKEKRFKLVIHGGAGTILKSRMTPEREAAYRATLAEALQTGHAVLKRGGSSLDAIEATIKVLEDSPLFNAGKGAVFTSEGTNELDASIMDGATLKAGAVAGVKRIKNPISLARLVMEKSPHVMMVGEGAETFARQNGIEWIDPKYFYTEERWKQLEEAKRKEKQQNDPAVKPDRKISSLAANDEKFGTVGAVALDKNGNLAAGTSTGGMTNKKFGRVGDAPIIGAGTYANNSTCAVSATGHGEYFIRSVVAHDIAALMEYRGLSLREAADIVVMKKLVKLGGEGGIIAIDKDGNHAMPFNSAGMYRGFIDADGKVVVEIYKE
ncbi:MAG TPA: isoaspartyl peptidase/L-asparaginase [Blastocatellia bacterium]|nr:isoaspartyl peptidase/L-asparaginase [Blastocatellia bacterium]